LTQKNCTAIFCARNKEILLEFLVQEMHGISLNAKHFFARKVQRQSLAQKITTVIFLWSARLHDREINANFDIAEKLLR